MKKPMKRRGRGKAKPTITNETEKEEGLVLEGVVTENLSNAQFRVKINESDLEILAHISGKMRMFYIRILPGDKVKVNVSPYDLTRGRIIYRFK